MKQKAIFIICKGLSLMQIKQNFLEGESPNFRLLSKNIELLNPGIQLVYELHEVYSFLLVLLTYL